MNVFDNNIKGYSIFIEIEVGLREFLIQLIISKGIENWFNNFLGSNQRKSIEKVVDYYSDPNSTQDEDFKDLYFKNLEKILKDKSYKQIQYLHHPFYYLNWPDLEGLFNLQANRILLETIISPKDRKLITELLMRLNWIRNDIAHSRLISKNELEIIKSSYNIISTVIPNFPILTSRCSYEENIPYTIKSLREVANNLEKMEPLEKSELISMKAIVIKSMNSFWIHSFYKSLIPILKDIFQFINMYLENINKLGGLLDINALRRNNQDLIINLKSKCDESV